MADVIVTVARHPAGLAVVCTAGILAGQFVVGWAFDRRVEIRGSWDDGCAWVTDVAVWVQVAVPAVGHAVVRAARTVLLWLLAHLLRAHGHHRAGVA